MKRIILALMSVTMLACGAPVTAGESDQTTESPVNTPSRVATDAGTATDAAPGAEMADAGATLTDAGCEVVTETRCGADLTRTELISQFDLRHGGNFEILATCGEIFLRWANPRNLGGTRCLGPQPVGSVSLGCGWVVCNK